MQFKALGRERVTWRTCWAGKDRIACSGFGAGVSKVGRGGIPAVMMSWSASLLLLCEEQVRKLQEQDECSLTFGV